MSPLSREDENLLRRRQASLSAVMTHPEWPEFVAEMERKIKRCEAEILKVAKKPEGADQRRIDFLRGCIAILQWEVSVPAHAERSLEDFLKRQGITSSKE